MLQMTVKKNLTTVSIGVNMLIVYVTPAGYHFVRPYSKWGNYVNCIWPSECQWIVPGTLNDDEV